jgi:hypothetical protein
MHEFRYKRCLFDRIPCLLVKGKIVVEGEGKVEEDIILAGEETLQFFNDPDS